VWKGSASAGTIDLVDRRIVFSPADAGWRAVHAVAHDVFISYSKSDKPTADAACAALEAAGVRCWCAPRDIPAGMSWPAAIVGAIGQSRIMVLVFSSHAIASDEVQREVVNAFLNGVTVVPFRIEDVRPTGDMAYYMASTHWLDAVTPPMAEHLKTLSQTVPAILATLRQRQAPSISPGFFGAGPQMVMPPITTPPPGPPPGPPLEATTPPVDFAEPEPVAPDVTPPPVTSPVVPVPNATAPQAAASAPVVESRQTVQSEPESEPESSRPEPTRPEPVFTRQPEAVPPPVVPIVQSRPAAHAESASSRAEVVPARHDGAAPVDWFAELTRQLSDRSMQITAAALIVYAILAAEVFKWIYFAEDRTFWYGWSFGFFPFVLIGAGLSHRWTAASRFQAFWFGFAGAVAGAANANILILLVMYLAAPQHFSSGDINFARCFPLFLAFGVGPSLVAALIRASLGARGLPVFRKWPSAYTWWMIAAAVVSCVVAVAAGLDSTGSYRFLSFALWLSWGVSPLLGIAVSRHWVAASRLIAFWLGFGCTLAAYVFASLVVGLLHWSSNANGPREDGTMVMLVTWVIGVVAGTIVGPIRAFLLMPDQRRGTGSSGPDFARVTGIAAIVLSLVGLVVGEELSGDGGLHRMSSYSMSLLWALAPLVGVAVSSRWKVRSRIAAFALGFAWTLATYVVASIAVVLIIYLGEPTFSRPHLLPFALLTWLIGIIAGVLVGTIRAFPMMPDATTRNG
jgi:TIR domain